MKETKRILKNIAKNNGIDPIELLVFLWDYKKFSYLENENSTIKNKDYGNVKNITSDIVKKRVNQKIRDKKPIEVKIREHDFSKIGREIVSIEYITIEEIIKIYEELVNDFSDHEDPIDPAGIKDQKLLESAIFHHRTSFNELLKYPTVETTAAALMYAVTHNHAFHNGNKRTALVAMLVFLDRHNMSLDCNDNELFKISLKLADHKLVDETVLYMDSEIEALSRWIHSKSITFKKGERPISLKKFKQILSHFDCIILPSGRVERRIKIPKTFFSSEKEEVLTSKKAIRSTFAHGDEIDKGLIRSIREDLRLTPESGIDSETFYEMENFTTSDFINKYKNVLRKLSKV